ncbi:putative HTH-type transcriptional regulator YbbH [Bacillus subtilis subsp. subtilis]|nr:putative HTH-type transcriptional regulator YbbH [Bacillus subtilis subsp. subtilis]
MATGGLAIIQSMKHKLPPSERKLADYILAHPTKQSKARSTKSAP